MNDGAVRRSKVTPEIVSRLIAEQFPQWAHLEVTPVELDGWDNTTFRFGGELAVRLPSADWYVPQIDKEHRWLPVLASQVPLPIPQPVAQGSPGRGFPRPWSVYRWLPGRYATIDRITDLSAMASALAEFLVALRTIDASGGPEPQMYGNRGGPVSWWDEGTRRAIAAAEPDMDQHALTDAWEASLGAPHWDANPVWVHGDISPANLLVDDGRLSAVIDFGSCGVGDPACDLAIAWTFLHGASRHRYRERLQIDDATWVRGRGWALWKALVVHAEARASDADDVASAGLQDGWRVNARAVINEVLAELA
jgi:aminoglycoside phosphotransferase (APT) family kinase protein